MTRISGILADSDIQALIENNFLKAQYPFDRSQIQPASLDLRLGRKLIVYVLLLCRDLIQKFWISLNG